MLGDMAHYFPVESPEHSEAVRYDEELLRNTISLLEDDDLLIVFSDHGHIDPYIKAHAYGSEEE